ncbi:hypothetical protein LIER_18085 [Lithospermum erythrorhizon]|uniref:Transmembrane protein n=1 Tax=Lithospermum erythrorhizon TaxID=34254 RepID=A0AAV3QEF3_LITER
MNTHIFSIDVHGTHPNGHGLAMKSVPLTSTRVRTSAVLCICWGSFRGVSGYPAVFWALRGALVNVNNFFLVNAYFVFISVLLLSPMPTPVDAFITF